MTIEQEGYGALMQSRHEKVKRAPHFAHAQCGLRFAHV